MFVQVALDDRLLVGEGDDGMVAAPVLPQREGKEVDFVVANIPKGGVDGRELKGATAF